jgi:hypothetical protein
VFISLSMLMRDYERVPTKELEDALFFFGSKRMWVWPETEVARREALQQPTRYDRIPSRLLELLERKDDAGEVFFLKPDKPGVPDVEVFGDYPRASTWLQGLGYQPLRLDPEWWRAVFSKQGGMHVDGKAWWCSL